LRDAGAFVYERLQACSLRIHRVFRVLEVSIGLLRLLLGRHFTRFDCEFVPAADYRRAHRTGRLDNFALPPGIVYLRRAARTLDRIQ
jgi:hypothetical protein